MFSMHYTDMILSWGILFQKSLDRCLPNNTQKNRSPTHEEQQTIVFVGPGTFLCGKGGNWDCRLCRRFETHCCHDSRPSHGNDSLPPRWWRIMLLPCSVIWATFALLPEENNDNDNDTNMEMDSFGSLRRIILTIIILTECFVISIKISISSSSFWP